MDEPAARRVVSWPAVLAGGGGVLMALTAALPESRFVNIDLRGPFASVRPGLLGSALVFGLVVAVAAGVAWLVASDRARAWLFGIATAASTSAVFAVLPGPSEFVGMPVGRYPVSVHLTLLGAFVALGASASGLWAALGLDPPTVRRGPGIFFLAVAALQFVLSFGLARELAEVGVSHYFVLVVAVLLAVVGAGLVRGQAWAWLLAYPLAAAGILNGVLVIISGGFGGSSRGLGVLVVYAYGRALLTLWSGRPGRSPQLAQPAEPVPAAPDPSAVECATCRQTFAWQEGYWQKTTPGAADPYVGDSLPRAFCPHCGELVAEYPPSADGWCWVDDNEHLNEDHPLPPEPFLVSEPWWLERQLPAPAVAPVAARRVDLSFLRAPSQPPAPRDMDDPFVRRCLELALVEEPEERTFDSDPALTDVVERLNAGDYAVAAGHAARLVDRFPDLDLVYLWWARALAERSERERAGEVLRRGLEASRRKYLLLDRVGELQAERGDITEAVYWWTQAVLAQERLRGSGGDVGPYLNLAAVAEGLGLADVWGALIGRVDRLRAGQIRLDDSAAQRLRMLAAEAGHEPLATVLRAVRQRMQAEAAPTPRPAVPAEKPPKSRQLVLLVLVGGLVVAVGVLGIVTFLARRDDVRAPAVALLPPEPEGVSPGDVGGAEDEAVVPAPTTPQPEEEPPPEAVEGAFLTQLGPMEVADVRTTDRFPEECNPAAPEMYECDIEAPDATIVVIVLRPVDGRALGEAAHEFDFANEAFESWLVEDSGLELSTEILRTEGAAFQIEIAYTFLSDVAARPVTLMWSGQAVRLP